MNFLEKFKTSIKNYFLGGSEPVYTTEPVLQTNFQEDHLIQLKNRLELKLDYYKNEEMEQRKYIQEEEEQYEKMSSAYYWGRLEKEEGIKWAKYQLEALAIDIRTLEEELSCVKEKLSSLLPVPSERILVSPSQIGLLPKLMDYEMIHFAPLPPTPYQTRPVVNRPRTVQHANRQRLHM